MQYLWKGGLAAALVAALVGGVGLFALRPDAAAPPYAGAWKVVFLNGDKQLAVGIVEAEERDGRPKVSLVDGPPLDGMPRMTDVEDARGDAKGLHFSLKTNQQNFPVAFYPPDGAARPDRIPGSVRVRGQLIPAWMERTAEKKLDPAKTESPLEGLSDFSRVDEVEGDADREKLLAGVAKKYAGKPVALYAARALAQSRGRRGAPEAESREAAEGFVRESAAYGPGMERQAALTAAGGLKVSGHKAAALEYAHRAEKLLPADASPSEAAPVLKVLAATLRANGDDPGAKKVSERLAELDKKLDEEFEKNSVPFTPDPYPGRKKKNDRVALVELFTGAHCPPCVAADIAFDAALQAYKPGQVALLQYHLHVPRPDPLTTADSEARSAYYGDDIPGTPTFFVDGRPGPQVGGPAALGKEGYGDLSKAINDALEEEPGARLRLAAHRNGDSIDLRAEVSDLKNPGPKVRLRFVLAEEVARYPGSNGRRLHHHVVRAFPGGVDGFALPEAAAKHEATAKVADLIADQEKYLTEAGKKRQFLDDERPLDYRRLRAFAFIQDDATKRILQAAQVDLGGPKERE